jgi:PTS system ascorbate-specific IIA component
MGNREIIELRNIKTRVSAADWRESIAASGSLLSESGYITSDYISLTIKSVEELGPYVVLMPGLALAHARPDESVIKTGISLITLREPVCFDCENDPVSVVLTLACKDAESHLEMLGILAGILANPDSMASIIEAESEEVIYKLINQY